MTPSTRSQKSWREVIKIHPAADLFPLMSPEELRVLDNDIKANGMHQPPVFAHDGSLVDGRNRLDGRELVGLPIYPGKQAGFVDRSPQRQKGIHEKTYERLRSEACEQKCWLVERHRLTSQRLNRLR